MAAALAGGQVDAVVTYPPYSLAIAASGARTIFTSQEIPDEILDVVAVAPRILERDPDLVRRLRTVWAETLAEMAANPAASTAVMARQMRVTPPDFTASLAGIAMTPAADQERLLAPGGIADRSLAEIGRMLAPKAQ